MSTPTRLNNDTSNAIGPMANFKITRSMGRGPTDGVTPVVRNSLTAPIGRNFLANCVMKPPTIKPIANITPWNSGRCRDELLRVPIDELRLAMSGPPVHDVPDRLGQRVPILALGQF